MARRTALYRFFWVISALGLTWLLLSGACTVTVALYSFDSYLGGAVLPFVFIVGGLSCGAGWWVWRLAERARKDQEYSPPEQSDQ